MNFIANCISDGEMVLVRMTLIPPEGHPENIWDAIMEIQKTWFESEELVVCLWIKEANENWEVVGDDLSMGDEEVLYLSPPDDTPLEFFEDTERLNEELDMMMDLTDEELEELDRVEEVCSSGPPEVAPMCIYEASLHEGCASCPARDICLNNKSITENYDDLEEIGKRWIIRHGLKLPEE